MGLINYTAHMKGNLRKYGSIWQLALPIVFCNCAGPTTPMGAVWAVTPFQATSFKGSFGAGTNNTHSAAAPKIFVTPTKQVLHGPSPLKIYIKDPTGDLTRYDFNVRYNGLDVSSSFARKARYTLDWNKRTLIVENPVLRLPATEDHLIEFFYKNSNGMIAYANYDAPICNAFRFQPVISTGNFSPPIELVSLISDVSRQKGINPGFMTGLVAQESGFNPKLVSWAKALGLTQITTVAEKEIIAQHPTWPRYRELENYSVSKVKLFIQKDKINRRNEWRLNPRLSVQGATDFIQAIAEKWSTKENKELIRILFDDPEIATNKLILASYHSGYNRVSAALYEHGKNWLKSPQLKEARKYVNKVFSYCHTFVDSEEALYAKAS
jgi:hypothetical protein